MTSDKNPDTVETQDYVPVALELIRPDADADFDIYLRRKDNAYVLYRGRHLPFTRDMRQRLRDISIEKVYVPAEQGKEYRRYVEQALPTIISDNRVKPQEKADVLYSSLTNLVEEVMADPRSGDLIPRSKELVNTACVFLNQEGGFLEYLMQVTSFDYYTYTHSVNVFVFTMAMAQHLLPPEQVNEGLGIGALLHDIGKSQIDPAIVNNPGRLSSEEFLIIKKHPGLGCDLLLEHKGVGRVALDLVRFHHEKMDGTGYPDGLSTDQLPMHARIIKIADVFDALTTKRSYKNAMNSFPALKLMQDEMLSGEIDPDLFRSFVGMMGDLPVSQKS